MDIQLCKRMCQLPTKQDYHTPKESTPLPHHDKQRCTPISTNRNGPYYGTTTTTWVQCYSHYHGSRMLEGSHLPTLHQYHHRTRNRTTIPKSCLPMVRTPFPND